MSLPPPPTITPALVDWLALLYPDKCPDVDTPLDVVRFRSGQASVVRKLRQVLADQEKNVLNVSKRV